MYEWKKWLGCFAMALQAALNMLESPQWRGGMGKNIFPRGLSYLPRLSFDCQVLQSGH
jgi:hypothetical protein